MIDLVTKKVSLFWLLVSHQNIGQPPPLPISSLYMIDEKVIHGFARSLDH